MHICEYKTNRLNNITDDTYFSGLYGDLTRVIHTSDVTVE